MIRFGHPSYVKEEIPEAIKRIAYDNKLYNWVDHVIALAKFNCERC